MLSNKSTSISSRCVHPMSGFTRLALHQCPIKPARAATRITSVPSGPTHFTPSITTNTSLNFARTLAITSTLAKMPRLTKDNINAKVVRAQYAVRGELAVKSEEYRAALKKGTANGLPFDQVISANIGNPQQLDQKPITFFRQVLSLLENPQLLEKPDVLVNELGYGQDALDRAKWQLAQCNSVGAYSASPGVPAFRESVAKFIEARDGFPANSKDIYLTAGASSGVNTMLNVLCASPKTGVMVPIPQYPLYTASLAVLDARCVPYYLTEETHWGTDQKRIEEAYSKACEEGTDVAAIVVINPGNPTGASLPEQDIRGIIDFARRRNLVIMADEVYQTNVFVGKFQSFKHVLRKMQSEAPDGKYDGIELVSMHSISKGMVGECGHRGGYFELVGFRPEVVEQIYKFVSIGLCPPVIGQCIVEMMVNPPKQGDSSYDRYRAEYDDTFNRLKSRATALYEAFQKMEGVECGAPQGSMYLFPTIRLPQKAIEAAKAAGREPDQFYCLKMLEATGICVVAGSGFGQVPGTWHFRTTFLAPGTEWVNSMAKFHEEFMNKYR